MYDSQSVDQLQTHVSNDGGASWTLVDSVTTTNQAWQTASFLVSDHVEPTSQMRVRFSVDDANDPSVVEAGIDNVALEVLDCDALCPPDVDENGFVNVDDLLAVIGVYGTDDPAADINGDGIVDVNDILLIIANWGEC